MCMRLFFARQAVFGELICIDGGPGMTGYKDFGWEEGATDAHAFLYPALRSMLGDKKQRILDLGCGNGAVACRLLGEGFDVYGVDASESGIRVANGKYPGRFFVCDITTRALPAELAYFEFDLVISTEVIEHLYAPRSYMALVREILGKRGGEVILSTPYHGYLKNLALALANKMDGHFTVLWDGGHIKFWSRETLTALLNEFGCRVVEFKGCGRLPYLWKSMLMRATVDTR